MNAARAYAQTEDFQRDRQRRPHVERIIACLTRYHGARRARRRGLCHADFQAKLSAMAFNPRSADDSSRALRGSTSSSG